MLWTRYCSAAALLPPPCCCGFPRPQHCLYSLGHMFVHFAQELCKNSLPSCSSSNLSMIYSLHFLNRVCFSPFSFFFSLLFFSPWNPLPIMPMGWEGSGLLVWRCLCLSSQDEHFLFCASQRLWLWLFHFNRIFLSSQICNELAVLCLWKFFGGYC